MGFQKGRIHASTAPGDSGTKTDVTLQSVLVPNPLFISLIDLTNTMHQTTVAHVCCAIAASTYVFILLFKVIDIWVGLLHCQMFELYCCVLQ